jgi:hypothetical protein
MQSVEVSADLLAWFMGTKASRLAVGDGIGYKRNVLDRRTSVVLNSYLQLRCISPIILTGYRP